MRSLLCTAAAFALTVAIAEAQYKTPTAPPPGSVQVAPNKNVQMQVSQPSPDDDLVKAERIPRDKAMKMVKEKKAVYIDVRGKEAYDESHIPGSINIPLGELMNRLKELPPRKFLITYCA